MISPGPEKIKCWIQEVEQCFHYSMSKNPNSNFLDINLLIIHIQLRLILIYHGGVPIYGKGETTSAMQLSLLWWLYETGVHLTSAKI